MSFLSRFENKISTVTMHGTLRRADGVEEVRSGPMRKKPQPAPLLVAQPDNNRDHHPATYGDDGGADDDDLDSPQVEKARGHRHHAAPQPQPKQLSPRKTQPQQLPSSPKKTHATPSKPAKTQQPDDSNFRGGASNDLKVGATNEDQLAFSKKARPVAYEPCTLTEYRQEKHDKYYELGKLQPDLNSSELVEKRANQERIKEFSKNLRQINQAVPRKAAPPAADDKAPKALSTRDKALAFAKQKVPKPKVRKLPSPVPVKGAPARKTRAADVDDDGDDGAATDDGPTNVMTELQQLQLKHRAARAQVEALMRDC